MSLTKAYELLRSKVLRTCLKYKLLITKVRNYAGILFYQGALMRRLLRLLIQIYVRHRIKSAELGWPSKDHIGDLSEKLISRRKNISNQPGYDDSKLDTFHPKYV